MNSIFRSTFPVSSVDNYRVFSWNIERNWYASEDSGFSFFRAGKFAAVKKTSRASRKIVNGDREVRTAARLQTLGNQSPICA